MRKVFALALSGLSAAPALSAGPTGWGDYSCMLIAAFPANITAPGVYCLSYKHIDFPMTDKFSPGAIGSISALIYISSDNVVLDLNGATLDGTPADPATAGTTYGVFAYNNTNNIKNVTVRNGTIKGFGVGVSLYGIGIPGDRSDIRPSRGHLVENIRAIGNRSMGIEVIGHDSVIRGNYVAGTGPFGVGWGIYAAGAGVHIVDNDVHHTRSNAGPSHGLYLQSYYSDGIVVNNRISHADVGISGSPVWGKYRDNVTANVTTPYAGGTDIGNNH
jgi:hypothetical protein